MSIKLKAFIIGSILGALLGWGLYHYWPQIVVGGFIVAVAGFFGCVFLNNYNLFGKAKQKVQ